MDRENTPDQVSWTVGVPAFVSWKTGITGCTVNISSLLAASLTPEYLPHEKYKKRELLIGVSSSP